MLHANFRNAMQLAIVLVLSGCVASSPGEGENAETAAIDPLEELMGDAQDCIPLNRIDRTEVVDAQTVLFFATGGEIYTNRLPNRCPGLGRHKTIMYKTSLNKLCNVDVITVLDQLGGGFVRGASCGLGAFIPVSESTVDLLRER